MKQSVARTVFYLCFLGMIQATAFGVEVNSSWQTLGQAKISQKVKTTVPFRPELTLEQNNRILKEHRSRNFAVSTSVPSNELDSLQLVNRSVRWQVDDQVVLGRVTAVMLSEDRLTTTIFAEVAAPQNSDVKLSWGDLGLLSVER